MLHSILAQTIMAAVAESMSNWHSASGSERKLGKSTTSLDIGAGEIIFYDLPQSIIIRTAGHTAFGGKSDNEVIPSRVFITIDLLSLTNCRKNQWIYNNDIMECKFNRFCYMQLIVVQRML